MKKEVLIAIVAGLILGLIITVGIYTANRSLNVQRAKKQMQSAPTPSLTPTANNKTLNLTSHENFDLIDDAAVNLSGVAWPGAVVALISEVDNQIIAADDEGIFVFKTKLIKGFNEITIVAADETGAIQTQNLILTYTITKIEAETSWLKPFVRLAYAAEATATAGAESVTEKIKERLQDTVSEGLVSIKEQLTSKAAAPRKKAYIGKILSLDEAGLTLTYKEQNYSVNLKPDTIYVKGANTAIDFEELKINDFVIAMGWYHADSQEFTAARLSRISQPEPPINRQLISGKISEVDGQKISLNNKTLVLTKKTDLTVSGIDKASNEDLALGDYLFAIVTLDSNGDLDTVNSVYVLPGKNNPAGLTPTNINNATGSAE